MSQFSRSHLWYMTVEDKALTSTSGLHFLQVLEAMCQTVSIQKRPHGISKKSCPQSKVHLSFNKLLPRSQHWEWNWDKCIFPTFSSCDFKASGFLQENKDCCWRIIYVYRCLQTSHLLLAIYSRTTSQEHDIQ